MLAEPVRTVSLDALAESLKRLGSVRVTVSTSSMSPAIQPGDLITVSRPEKLLRGDIVVITTDSEWIIHRLLSIRNVNGTIYAITRGDNTSRPDQPCQIEHIIGKVEGSRLNIQQLDNALLLASFPAEDISNIDDLLQGNDPTTFAEAAEKEGLLPLITFSLPSSFPTVPSAQNIPNPSSSPSPFQVSGFRSQVSPYLSLLGRNIIFLKILNEAASALSGLDFILLKGAYLASEIYSSPGLRQFSDIDILVKEHDVPTTTKRLAEIGFESDRSNSTDTVSASPFLNSILLKRLPSEPSLHIHWHIQNSITPKYMQSNMNINEIWHAARPTNNPWLALSPEHLIIHLCEHALRHSFARLILIRDIAEVITKLEKDINWNLLASECSNFNLSRPVWMSLLYTNVKTGVFIPAHFLQILCPKRPGIAGRIFMRLAVRGKRHPELCNLAYFDCITTISGKLQFLTGLLFPPKAVLAYAYNIPPKSVNISLYIKRTLRGILNLARIS